jgi:hypothetical protein
MLHRGIPIPTGGIGEVQYGTMQLGGTKLASSFIRLLVAELGMLVIGSTIGGLKSIALCDFNLLGKVALAKHV